MTNYLKDKVSEGELETLEFQVDIYQGGMDTPLIRMFDLVSTLNDNSVGITNMMDYGVTRWHCQGAVQANRCVNAIVDKVEAGTAIPYRLLSKEKNSIFVQNGEFPEGS